MLLSAIDVVQPYPTTVDVLASACRGGDAGERWQTTQLLLTMHIAGVALIGGQERSYTLQIEQTAQQTFALEARRLSAQTLSDGPPPALRLSGPDSHADQ